MQTNKTFAEQLAELTGITPTNILTYQTIKEMAPGSRFATGVVVDNNTGLNISNTGKLLRWVAVRGGGYDWAIYYGYAGDDSLGERGSQLDWIVRYGQKLHDGQIIKKLVPCDTMAFALYRQ